MLETLSSRRDASAHTHSGMPVNELSKSKAKEQKEEEEEEEEEISGSNVGKEQCESSGPYDSFIYTYAFVYLFYTLYFRLML